MGNSIYFITGIKEFNPDEDNDNIEDENEIPNYNYNTLILNDMNKNIEDDNKFKEYKSIKDPDLLEMKEIEIHDEFKTIYINAIHDRDIYTLVGLFDNNMECDIVDETIE